MEKKKRILKWVAIPFSRGSSDLGIDLGLLCCKQGLCHVSHQGNLWLIFRVLNNVILTVFTCSFLLWRGEFLEFFAISPDIILCIFLMKTFSFDRLPKT